MDNINGNSKVIVDKPGRELGVGPYTTYPCSSKKDIVRPLTFKKGLYLFLPGKIKPSMRTGNNIMKTLLF